MENNCVPKDKKFVPVIESKLRKKIVEYCIQCLSQKL